MKLIIKLIEGKYFQEKENLLECFTGIVRKAGSITFSKETVISELIIKAFIAQSKKANLSFSYRETLYNSVTAYLEEIVIS
jgi:hypothetical protein